MGHVDPCRRLLEASAQPLEHRQNSNETQGLKAAFGVTSQWRDRSRARNSSFEIDIAAHQKRHVIFSLDSRKRRGWGVSVIPVGRSRRELGFLAGTFLIGLATLEIVLSTAGC